VQKLFELQNPQMIGKPFAEIKIVYIEQLPIIRSIPPQQFYIDLVNQILAKKAESSDNGTSDLEAQIDQLVYMLYDLSPTEIATIDSSFIHAS
jgi:adenine-specific DNA-methyltransferase